MPDRVVRPLRTLPRGVTNLTLLARQAVAVPTSYPVTLSARTQFVSGVAALVFVSPHVLDASLDHAEFGLRVHHPEAEVDDQYEFTPPHPDARLVTWFRSTDPSRGYMLVVTCVGIGSFTLVDDAGTEVVKPDPTKTDRWTVGSVKISRPFGGSSNWCWFSLTNPAWWALTRCEILQVP